MLTALAVSLRVTTSARPSNNSASVLVMRVCVCVCVFEFVCVCVCRHVCTCARMYANMFVRKEREEDNITRSLKFIVSFMSFYLLLGQVLIKVRFSVFCLCSC